jgi:hypothetical protein
MLLTNDHQLKLVADRKSAKARQIYAAACDGGIGPADKLSSTKIFSLV